MKTVFADTFYYLAFLGERDAAHDRAIRFSEKYTGGIVTTSWVLIEVADALAAPERRTRCAAFLRQLRGDPSLTIAQPSEPLFQRGLDLYASRDDKDWSLTNCISFVVMEDYAIAEALTCDHHFEQAGFRALLS
jgi:predicted nucleic acid-binding protein